LFSCAKAPTLFLVELGLVHCKQLLNTVHSERQNDCQDIVQKESRKAKAGRDL
jgi:hypothetical protein